MPFPSVKREPMVDFGDTRWLVISIVACHGGHGASQRMLRSPQPIARTLTSANVDPQISRYLSNSFSSGSSRPIATFNGWRPRSRRLV